MAVYIAFVSPFKPMFGPTSEATSLGQNPILEFKPASSKREALD
jgi:hypothetical protein